MLRSAIQTDPYGPGTGLSALGFLAHVGQADDLNDLRMSAPLLPFLLAAGRLPRRFSNHAGSGLAASRRCGFRGLLSGAPINSASAAQTGNADGGSSNRPAKCRKAGVRNCHSLSPPFNGRQGLPSFRRAVV